VQPFDGMGTMSEPDHPNTESNDVEDSIKNPRHIIGGLGSGLLWFIVDLTFVWPDSHERFVIFLCAWFVFYWIDAAWLSQETMLKAVASTIAVGVIGYCIVPKTPRPESENHCWIDTGNQPTPPGLCKGVKPDEMAVELGDDLVIVTDKSYYIAVQLPCTKIIFERTPDGDAAISAVLHDKQGRLAAKISQNEIRLMPWEDDWSTRIEEPNNRNAVRVFDSYERPVLSLTSLNSQLIEFQAVFYCGADKYTLGFPSGINGPHGVSIDHLCLGGGTVGVDLNY
jgi:hypothetical protein